MKYKVGDKVKIRDDLIIGKEYGGVMCLLTIAKDLGGNIFKIGCITAEENYKLKGRNYIVSDEMIEGKVEDMLQFAGWNILQKIANKEIKEGTIINDGEHSYIFDGKNFKDENSHTFLTARYDDNKFASLYFEIMEEQLEEINI